MKTKKLKVRSLLLASLFVGTRNRLIVSMTLAVAAYSTFAWYSKAYELAIYVCLVWALTLSVTILRRALVRKGFKHSGRYKSENGKIVDIVVTYERLYSWRTYQKVLRKITLNNVEIANYGAEETEEYTLYVNASTMKPICAYYPLSKQIDYKNKRYTLLHRLDDVYTAKSEK